MDSTHSDYIAPAEWRWVLLLGCLMMLASLVPFAAVGMVRPAPDLLFLGVTHDLTDSAGVLALMTHAAEGGAFPQPRYTPEPLPNLLTDLLYSALGRVAKAGELDVQAVFHVVRLLAGLLMVHTFYLLAAQIWQRVTARRTFSAIASLGGGLGWALAPVLGTTLDSGLTPAYPFHSLLMNAHWPLATAALSLLAAAGISALRRGSTEKPAVTNYGLRLFLFSMLLMIIDPPALLPFALGFLFVVGLHGLKTRLFARNALILLWFGVPALPLIGFLVASALQNPLAFTLWLRDSTLPTVPLWGVLVGLGVPLVMAVPALWGVVRKLEPDDSALMLFWLSFMLLCGYALPVLGGAFWIGLMLPVAYFATRAAFAFWARVLPSPLWRLRLGIVGVLVIALGHLPVALAPLANDQRDALHLESAYIEASAWLMRETPLDAVVLASPKVSVWLPALTGRRVVYAAPDKALYPLTAQGVARTFFGSTNPADCRTLLDGTRAPAPAYRVDYVLVGPQERALGAAGCTAGLPRLFEADGVEVFAAR
jgi:hypothetical protein